MHDKAFSIAKNPKYEGYQNVLLQWFTIFLIKNLDDIMPNQELAEELHKLIIAEFYKKYLGANLVDMQLISKFNKRI